MGTIWRKCFVFLAVIGLVAPRSARADNAAEAKAHSETGNSLYEKHKFVEALTHLTDAYRLVPTSSRALAVVQIYDQLIKEEDGLKRRPGAPRCVALLSYAIRKLRRGGQPA